jgi:CRISPR-associated endonuclease Cas2
MMELFRVPLVDMPVIAALNRQTFDADADFDEVPERVLLSERGRAKLIEVLERRRRDVWRHDVVGYSLSYTRIVELEVRLLEKEWTGEPGLFGRLRLRLMAAADKRWRVVCYDVRHPKRYRRVYKIVSGSGRRLQYSVFRCWLDDREVEKLRWRLANVMDAVDSLLIIDLCPNCAARVIAKNRVESWAPEPSGFRIVGVRSDHAPTKRNPEDA